jgi:hypothetical protein
MRLRTHIALVHFDPTAPLAFTIEPDPENEDGSRVMLDYKANHEITCLFEGDLDQCELVLDLLGEKIYESPSVTGDLLDLRDGLDTITSDEEDEDEDEDEDGASADDVSDDEFDDTLDKI